MDRGRGQDLVELARERAEHDPHAGAMHHRLHGFDNQVQREQDQPETDRGAANLTRARLLARQEHRHAGEQENRG